MSYGNEVDNATTISLEGSGNTAALEVLGSDTAEQSAAIAGRNFTGGITKTGTGTLILSAANTYQGRTAVSSGTLLVTGSIDQSGFAAVRNGATLGGTGTVGRVTVDSGGVIAPGVDGIGTLTIDGDYDAIGGRLALDAELGDDGSPADRLVIDGNATGTTTVAVTNLGGAGGQTTGDGVLVVQVSGSSEDDAFTLAAPVVAGAYQYNLFEGGLDGSGEDWFLRSALRSAVGAYGAVAPLAGDLALAMLASFHERQGDQKVTGGTDVVPGAWMRLYGRQSQIGYHGTADATFDGSLYGFQAGLDVFGIDSSTGIHHRGGGFVGHSHVGGSVAGAFPGDDASVGLDGTSFGLYWTMIGASGWYLDTVAMATRFGGSAADASASLPIAGSGLTVSGETGIPLALGAVTIEPQAQLVWTGLRLEDSNDGLADVSFDPADRIDGRVGIRAAAEWAVGTASIRPYAKANIWHAFGDDDAVDVGGSVIATEQGATWLELGGGVVAELTPDLGVFASADYTMGLRGRKRRIVEANVGLLVNL